MLRVAKIRKLEWNKENQTKVFRKKAKCRLVLMVLFGE